MSVPVREARLLHAAMHRISMFAGIVVTEGESTISLSDDAKRVIHPVYLRYECITFQER